MNAVREKLLISENWPKSLQTVHSEFFYDYSVKFKLTIFFVKMQILLKILKVIYHYQIKAGSIKIQILIAI